VVAEGRAGFTLVRTPYVESFASADLAERTKALVRDPLVLLDEAVSFRAGRGVTGAAVSMLVVVLRVGADGPVAVRGGAGPLGPVLAIGRGSDQLVLDLPASPRRPARVPGAPVPRWSAGCWPPSMTTER